MSRHWQMPDPVMGDAGAPTQTVPPWHWYCWLGLSTKHPSAQAPAPSQNRSGMASDASPGFFSGAHAPDAVQ